MLFSFGLVKMDFYSLHLLLSVAKVAGHSSYGLDVWSQYVSLSAALSQTESQEHMQQICFQVIKGAGITLSLGEAWKAMLGQTRFYESYWDRLIFGFQEPRQQRQLVPEVTTSTFIMLFSLCRLLHRVFRFSVICGGKVDWLFRRFVVGLSRPFVAGTKRRAKTCLHVSCLLLIFAAAAFVASFCHHVVER